MSESGFTIAPPNPPNSTAKRTRAVLAWFGWTVVYAGTCVAVFFAFEKSVGQTTWYFLPVLAIWAAVAFGIGILYPRKAWCFGPLAAGLLPPVLLFLGGLAGMAMLGRPAREADAAGWYMFFGLGGIVFIGPPAIAMSFFAWLGVQVGKQRLSRSIPPHLTTGGLPPTRPSFVGPSAPIPAIYNTSAQSGYTAPTPHRWIAESMGEVQPSRRAAASTAPAFAHVAAPTPETARDLIETILSTPMPRDLGAANRPVDRAS